MSQALHPFQTGYVIEDNFDDSSIHSRWEVSTPGSTTAVEGSDGITLSAIGTDDASIKLYLPEGMASRNWVMQVHCTFAFTGTPGDASAGQMQLRGKGGGADKWCQAYLLANPSYFFSKQDTAGSSTVAGSTTLWLRMRSFGDEVRTDYYSGAHTVDIDTDGYWVEHEGTQRWYIVPRSASYDYPTVYEYMTLKAAQWGANPGCEATFRKFRLQIF